MHPTLGILARFQAFFYASAFSQLDGFAVPAPARVTQTVETVEKAGESSAKRWGFISQRTLWQNTNQAMKTKWSCSPSRSRTNLFQEPWSTPPIPRINWFYFHRVIAAPSHGLTSPHALDCRSAKYYWHPLHAQLRGLILQLNPISYAAKSKISWQFLTNLH